MIHQGSPNKKYSIYWHLILLIPRSNHYFGFCYIYTILKIKFKYLYFIYKILNIYYPNIIYYLT
jgi:hypothetical protein